jgi:DNA-binding transcriptional ArsR family regulator
MDADQLIKATQSTQRLIQDEYFYKYIFKRTERIVSVVFYITQSVPKTELPQSVRDDIEAAARASHSAILHSLEARAHAADEVLFTNIHTLVSLLSHLQVAQSIGAVSKEVLGVLSGEIDAAIRAMNKYMEHDPVSLKTGNEHAPALEHKAPVKARDERKGERPSVGVPHTKSVPNEGKQETGRRAQILTIIEARGEVGVKDISAIVKDVSEKTIQRELNDMIDAGLIIREGERRWSRYKIL